METLGRFLTCGRRELEGVNVVFNSVHGDFLCDVPTLTAKCKSALTSGAVSAIIKIVH